MQSDDIGRRVASLEAKVAALEAEVNGPNGLRQWRHRMNNEVAPLILSYEDDRDELYKLMLLASKFQGGWKAVAAAAVLSSGLVTALWAVMTHFRVL